MKIQPKLASLVLSVLIVGLTFTLFSLQTKYVKAQNEPIPGLWIPCSETRENEFHTLRPYQASNCGDYPTQALFCSNKLVIFENFQLSSECRDQRSWTTGSFDCEVDVYVEPHDLNITLEDSELPIMGNTQDELDDATKLNEYASWYLSGVESVGSTGETNDFRTVNYSGPLNKLLPQMVQESVRIETIRKATTIEEFTVLDENEQETTLSTAAFHDQYVVCGEVFKFLWIELGPFKPTDCYSGNEKLRIGDWDGDLSLFNNIVNRLGVDAWNKRYPPLPWDDGTVENPSEENPPVPFKNQKDYLKAYNEWRGQSCATIPFVDINVCIENPFVPNKWAELYPYIPMASNADSEGKNYLLTGDGPNYVESQGTTIEGAQHSSHTNPLLYFAHMQEVMGLSGLLNQTYWPQGYESEKIPETTEKLKKGISTTPIIPNDTLSSHDPYNALDCTAVNVRVNEGDDLFPGDRPSGKELFVGGVEYRITGVKCYEEYEDRSHLLCGPNLVPCRPLDTLRCHAQVGIEFKLGTKTPYGEEIFSQTVADSGSVFRRIFPKVEEGAPVECIADIPTQTGVTYSIDNPLHQEPVGGTQDFRQIAYPADGASGDTMLTFAHIGSVYEYFLKGIQTALRPKGFGEPIANGNCVGNITCGELPELPKATGACNLSNISSRIGDIPESLKEIVSAAAETYKVQPNLILAIMFGEGAFNQPPYKKYDWTEENVKNWATCEPLPNCTGPQSSIVSGLALNWSTHVDRVFDDLKKIDPTKERSKIDGCNLIDEIYIIAHSLKEGAGGGVDLAGKSCYGITMSSSIPTSCDWNDSQIQTAIRQYQFGSYWTPFSSRHNVQCPYPGGCNCATLPGSCATGGGINAGCDKPGDSCEKVGNPNNTSHNACVFDVAKGK